MAFNQSSNPSSVQAQNWQPCENLEEAKEGERDMREEGKKKKRDRKETWKIDRNCDSEGTPGS